MDAFGVPNLVKAGLRGRRHPRHAGRGGQAPGRGLHRRHRRPRRAAGGRRRHLGHGHRPRRDRRQDLHAARPWSSASASRPTRSPTSSGSRATPRTTSPACPASARRRRRQLLQQFGSHRGDVRAPGRGQAPRSGARCCAEHEQAARLSQAPGDHGARRAARGGPGRAGGAAAATACRSTRSTPSSSASSSTTLRRRAAARWPAAGAAAAARPRPRRRRPARRAKLVARARPPGPLAAMLEKRRGGAGRRAARRRRRGSPSPCTPAAKPCRGGAPGDAERWRALWLPGRARRRPRRQGAARLRGGAGGAGLRHGRRRLPARARAAGEGARPLPRSPAPTTARSSSTGRRPRRPRPRAPCSRGAWPRQQRPRLVELGLERPLPRDRAAAGARAGAHGGGRRQDRPVPPGRDHRARARPHRRARATRICELAGGAVHHRLAAAARRGALRPPRPGRRHARARPATRPTRACSQALRDQHAIVPRGRGVARAHQAAQHVPRAAARRPRPAHRPAAHHLQPDWWRPPAASRAPTRTCRTSPCAPSWAPEIRACFVAEEGSRLVVADYSQIELRLMAQPRPGAGAASTPTTAARTCTASRRRPWPASPWRRSRKQPARARQGDQLRHHVRPLGLRPLGAGRACRVDEAKAFIEAYFAQVPAREGVPRARHRPGDAGRLRDHAVRPPPRRARAALANFRERSLGERLAVNTVLQGTAADIIKVAMVAVSRELDEARHGARGSSCRCTTSSSSSAPEAEVEAAVRAAAARRHVRRLRHGPAARGRRRRRRRLAGGQVGPPPRSLAPAPRHVPAPPSVLYSIWFRPAAVRGRSLPRCKRRTATDREGIPTRHGREHPSTHRLAATATQPRTPRRSSRAAKAT